MTTPAGTHSGRRHSESMAGEAARSLQYEYKAVSSLSIVKLIAFCHLWRVESADNILRIHTFDAGKYFKFE